MSNVPGSQEYLSRDYTYRASIKTFSPEVDHCCRRNLKVLGRGCKPSAKSGNSLLRETPYIYGLCFKAAHPGNCKRKEGNLRKFSDYSSGENAVSVCSINSKTCEGCGSEYKIGYKVQDGVVTIDTTGLLDGNVPYFQITQKKVIHFEVLRFIYASIKTCHGSFFEVAGSIMIFSQTLLTQVSTGQYPQARTSC